MTRLPVVAFLAVALLGCGGRAGPGPGDGDGDGAVADDGGAVGDGAHVDDGPHGGDGARDSGPPDGNPLAFCTGDFPHMVANGIESHPAVTGKVLPLNCCDAAEFEVITATVPSSLVPIVVMWRAQVGQASLPATIDLAAPPDGWGVEVVVGCEPLQPGCNPAPDSYSSGLEGSLQVARTAAGGYDMSLCLRVVEPAGEPHPLLHSLELYAPHVSASY